MSVPAATLQQGMTLRQLLKGIAVAPKIAISGIAADSRRLQEGNVFLACQGALSHGLDFVAEAIESGAAAIVWDATTGHAPDVPVPAVAVDHLAERLGDIANRWFEHPSHAVRVHGVTGTNGKTTVAYLLRECFQALGKRCGYVGTVGAGVTELEFASPLTTPPCIELHELLADFRGVGAEHAAVEVSSHAIEQLRIDGVRFESAIFTNLTRDHIDYHGDMRKYFETKARLFVDSDVAQRIVNIDDKYGAELANRGDAEYIQVSANIDRAIPNTPFVFARAIDVTANGFEVALASSWGDSEFSISLPGEFNVSNALQVLATLLAQQTELQRACAVLADVAAPPGRMQRVKIEAARQLPAVYVDYSHTPASLELALTALRSHTSGAVWCVFGCGGDRDRGKRPMMGSVAERLADTAIVTNDNPRTENPAEIIADIKKGMHPATLAIEDRDAAIQHVIASAAPHDAILIAGKGHEDYQIIGTDVIRFSDCEIAARYLEARSLNGGVAQ